MRRWDGGRKMSWEIWWKAECAPSGDQLKRVMRDGI